MYAVSINQIPDILHFNDNQWYLISLDITDCRLYIEKPVLRKKSIPKNKYNIKFTNRVLDFINVAGILRMKEIIDSRPDFIEQDDIPMVIYTLT